MEHVVAAVWEDNNGMFLDDDTVVMIFRVCYMVVSPLCP